MNYYIAIPLNIYQVTYYLCTAKFVTLSCYSAHDLNKVEKKSYSGILMTSKSLSNSSKCQVYYLIRRKCISYKFTTVTLETTHPESCFNGITFLLLDSSANENDKRKVLVFSPCQASCFYYFLLADPLPYSTWEIC